MPLYIDTDHLSTAGSLRAARFIMSCLQKSGGSHPFTATFSTPPIPPPLNSRACAAITDCQPSILSDDFLRHELAGSG